MSEPARMLDEDSVRRGGDGRVTLRAWLGGRDLVDDWLARIEAARSR